MDEDRQAGEEHVSCIGAGASNLYQVPGLSSLSTPGSLSLRSVVSLCVHGNNLSSLEGLEQLTGLTDLNLSSNLLTSTRSVQCLSNLERLNLASNQLQELEGLSGLSRLHTLVAAHNYIHSLASLLPARSGLRSLSNLDLRNNRLESLQEVMYLAPLPELASLQLQGNPIAFAQGYRPQVAVSLPQIAQLDKEPLLLPGGMYGPQPPPYPVQSPGPVQANPYDSGQVMGMAHGPYGAAFPYGAPQPYGLTPSGQRQFMQRPAHPMASNPADHNRQPSSAAWGDLPRPVPVPVPDGPEDMYQWTEDKLRDAAAQAVSKAMSKQKQTQKAQDLEGTTGQQKDVRSHETELGAGQEEQENLSGQPHKRDGQSRKTPKIDTALAGFQRRRSSHTGGRPLGPHNPPAQSSETGSPNSAAKHESSVAPGPTKEMEDRLLMLERRMLGLMDKSPNTVRESTVMRSIQRRGSSMLVDATSQTAQVGHQVDLLEKEAEKMRSELTLLAEKLHKKAEEADQRARQVEAEAAAQMFEMQREIDSLRAHLEEAEDTVAATEEAEAEMASRAEDLETELAQCAEELKDRDGELARLREALEAEKSANHTLQEEAKQTTKYREEKLEERARALQEQSELLKEELIASTSRAEAAEASVAQKTEALQAAELSLQATASKAMAAEAELRQEIQALQQYTRSQEESLQQGAREVENGLRSEIMQLSAALSDAHQNYRENLQMAQQAQEHQLRAALERESIASEARGRKFAAAEALEHRDQLQTKLAQTEAEFRCCLRDHQAEVQKLKEESLRHGKDKENAKHALHASSARVKELEGLVTELTEVVAAQKAKLKAAALGSAEASHRAGQQYQSELEYMRKEVGRLQGEVQELGQLRAATLMQAKEMASAKEEATALADELARIKREASAALEAAEQRAGTAEEEAHMAEEELEAARDATRVKEKMVDSANSTIEELKDALTQVRGELADERKMMQDAESDWSEREAEAQERQASLRAEIDAQEAAVEDALVSAEEAKAKVRSLEKKLLDISAKLKEKDEMLRYIGEEIEQCKQMFEEKEGNLKTARDDATKLAAQHERAKDEAQSEVERLKGQLSSLASRAERDREKATEAQEAHARCSRQLEEARQQVAQVEGEMRELLRAHEAQKAASSRRVAALAKAVEALKAPDSGLA